MARPVGPAHVVRELWRTREVVVTLTLRELKARYRGSVFGYFWTLLNPLMLLGIYSLVFSVYARMETDDGGPYAILLFSGLLPWLWFAGALTTGTTTLVRNHRMITHSAFPPQILPTVEVLAALINCALSVPVLIGAMLLFGRPPGPGIALLPLIFLAQAALILGLSLAASALTVFYRDVQFIIGNFLIFWMFLTPGILYPLSRVESGLASKLPPDAASAAVALIHYANPMAPIIQCWQGMFYRGGWPLVPDLIASGLHGFGLLAFGLAVFGHYRYPLVEEI